MEQCTGVTLAHVRACVQYVVLTFALDHNDQPVHINDTQSKLTYYYPYCGVPLTILACGEQSYLMGALKGA